MKDLVQLLMPVVMGAIASWLQGRPFEKFNINEKLKDILNLLVAAIFSVLAGTISSIFVGELSGVEWTGENLITNIYAVFAASQIVFKLYFKDKIK